MARDYSEEQVSRTTLGVTLNIDWDQPEGRRSIAIDHTWDTDDVTWRQLLEVCLDAMKAAGYSPPSVEEMADEPPYNLDAAAVYE